MAGRSSQHNQQASSMQPASSRASAASAASSSSLSSSTLQQTLAGFDGTQDDSQDKPKRPQNKAAADKYRRRKKERFETMQQDVERYTRENTELAVKATRLENEKAFLSTLLESAVRSSANPFAALLNIPQSLITPGMLPRRVDPALFQRSKNVMEKFVKEHDAQVEKRIATLEGRVHALVKRLGTSSGHTTSSTDTGDAA
ncbi:hypothetical protein PTSG_00520 [Salpingoeca rosetta]|uniref:BZIP domain-containing protein n=1 Tax=Salpingoeca rosetta (strain ATCC 50818 / BSB-021) TaxID=946362 RepID=F2TWP8_SALR5|nr:uncharacterized protein PTSG_00520 [Salpingoeca rosetta]EGD72494.1 hypothetical protein PTSG_00520 [Salpingoeca rosetta]|eukprot:XP_004999063.1 hypothetical protein PTSG_00520 [Salpingoeca rosetta]